MGANITIFKAKKVITMNPARPEAPAVAVRDGKILGVGTEEELKGWGEYTPDDTFTDKILIPGLIEAHSHAMEGMMWTIPYVGYFERWGPDGNLWEGCKSIDSVIDKLRSIEAEMSDPDEPLIAWGLDPIYFEGERMAAVQLDQVSTTRSVGIIHANAHLMTVNTALMTKEGIDENTTTEGVPRGADGKPTGELQEIPAMMLAGEIIPRMISANREPRAWRTYGRQAQNAGCTTVADLGYVGMDDAAVGLLHEIVDAPDFPVRISAPYMVLYNPDADLEQVADYIAGLGEQSSEKLKLGLVKVLLDGSIQGFTARLKEPGYFGRDDKGIWLIPPDAFKDYFLPFHRRGLTVHCHCNGDEAVDVFIDAVEQGQAENAYPDARHTVQHCQLTTVEQYQRMARLGMAANIFANHIFYWGDQHYAITVGPDRAERMEACATAKNSGIRFALHADTPVTPFGQLHNVWCAVNRLTASGRTLGETEKISVYDALKAVTLDAAYTLRLDDALGSIEPGKCADFTVLEEDPFEVDPIRLKDIPIWGTVLGGKPIAAPKRS